LFHSGVAMVYALKPRYETPPNPFLPAPAGLGVATLHIKGANYVASSLKALLGAGRQTIPTEVILREPDLPE